MRGGSLPLSLWFCFTSPAHLSPLHHGGEGWELWSPGPRGPEDCQARQLPGPALQTASCWPDGGSDVIRKERRGKRLPGFWAGEVGPGLGKGGKVGGLFCYLLIYIREAASCNGPRNPRVASVMAPLCRWEMTQSKAAPSLGCTENRLLVVGQWPRGLRICLPESLTLRVSGSLDPLWSRALKVPTKRLPGW